MENFSIFSYASIPATCLALVPDSFFAVSQLPMNVARDLNDYRSEDLLLLVFAAAFCNQKDRGRRIPLLENNGGFLVSCFPSFLLSWFGVFRFQGFSASWLIGFLAYWLLSRTVSGSLGFLVSWLQSFLVYQFIGFLVFGFLVSKFQIVNASNFRNALCFVGRCWSHITKSPFHVFFV